MSDTESLYRSFPRRKYQKVRCPKCGLELPFDTRKCPRCGICIGC